MAKKVREGKDLRLRGNPRGIPPQGKKNFSLDSKIFFGYLPLTGEGYLPHALGYIPPIRGKYPSLRGYYPSPVRGKFSEMGPVCGVTYPLVVG